MSAIDSDRPVSQSVDDEYGFAGIADKLAPSIAALTRGEGTVFGIEGPWGSGKTSFLAFLREAITKATPGIAVITVAPWLIGDKTSMVDALMSAMLPVLDRLENEQASDTGSGFWKRRGAKISDTAGLLRDYAILTGRSVSPVAGLVGLFVPGVSFAKDVLDKSTDALEASKPKGGQSELKARITERIKELDAHFVVIIDDLDRLEPRQAAEVVRLVRSVADFPNLAYVLCYDRSILAHAIKEGLSVEDGDLYLQKIVQLTFSLPMPEPFDLRISLRDKLLRLYGEVHGNGPGNEERSALSSAIDTEGGALRTPRDVKLVYNNIAFVFASIKDDVYFPDLCRISLIKVLKPALYSWIQEYLSIRAMIVSGDGRIGDVDRAELGNRLKTLLPDADPSGNSIWRLRRFIPGIAVKEDPKERVFETLYGSEVEALMADRRIGSPLHHRYYFALTGPRAFLPTQDVAAVRELAGRDLPGLTERILSYVSRERPLGKSWYEHLLQRLDDAELRLYNVEQLTGLLTVITHTADRACATLDRYIPFTVTVSQRLRLLVNDIITRLRALDAGAAGKALDALLRTGDPVWLVDEWVRQQLFDHGIVGDRAKPPEARVLTADEIKAAKSILKPRIAAAAPGLMQSPQLGGFLWGWRDLLGLRPVKSWVGKQCVTDAGLLDVLDGLRGWAVSDKVYHPLSKSAVENFLKWDEVTARLDAIEAGADTVFRERATDIKLAIQQSAGLG